MQEGIDHECQDIYHLGNNRGSFDYPLSVSLSSKIGERPSRGDLLSVSQLGYFSSEFTLESSTPPV